MPIRDGSSATKGDGLHARVGSRFENVLTAAPKLVFYLRNPK